MVQTATNTEMKTFPAPLLRLILSGGGGLPPAYGPVIRADGQEFVWDGKSGRAFAVSVANGAVISDDLTVVEGWRLPLCDGSPWLDRLAEMSSWMLTGEMLTGASIERSDPKFFRSITLMGWRRTRDGERGWGREYRWNWNPETGDDHDAVLKSSHLWLTLATLPARLTTLPPVAALPLALHDLPEVAARVAIAAG